jgi:flavin-dependent dehydrogenase
MHLGNGGYIGLVQTDEDWINVCGLFRLQPDIKPKKSPMLLSYLERVGLHDLATALGRAEWRDGSQSAVAGFRLGWQPTTKQLPCVGDAQSIIPPFTGNGMSMALEAAALAVEPLRQYATHKISWAQATTDIQNLTNQAFHRRLQISGAFQHLLLAPWFRKPLEILAEQKLLPFHTLFHFTRH